MEGLTSQCRSRQGGSSERGSSDRGGEEDEGTSTNAEGWSVGSGIMVQVMDMTGRGGRPEVP